MTPTLLIALFVVLAMTLFLLRVLGANHAAPRPVAPPRAPRAAGAASSSRPQPRAQATAQISTAPARQAPSRERMRDRYLAARFPSLFRCCEELKDTRRVIKAARLFFEEDRLDRAHELLDMAITQSPGEERLRLAQLEIAFLERDGVVFTRLARAYRDAHPGSSDWDEVVRLGAAIAPAEALFARSGDAPGHRHYGPWPEMPNWIEASWDLTSEVLAADLHRALVMPAPVLRRAA